MRMGFDGELLRRLVATAMPFGKFAGRPLVELPEGYLLWFRREGFPPGELGLMMALALEIKVNGLEHLLTPLLRRG